MTNEREIFTQDVSWEIRRQIMMYESARCMSDTERARFLGLPEGCRIREGAKIICQENLVIGNNCWIGENAILDASGGLEIGANTSIGLCTFIWTHDSHLLNIEGTNTAEYKDKIIRKPTKIGDNCFIGGPSVVMPGVTIGNNCVIAPMSLVYEDMPDRSVCRTYKNMSRSLIKNNKQIKDLKERISVLEEQIKRISKLDGDLS